MNSTIASQTQNSSEKEREPTKSHLCLVLIRLFCLLVAVVFGGKISKLYMANFNISLLKVLSAPPPPLSYYSRLRWGAELKKIIPEAIERDFTDILVVNEDQKRPNGLLAIHLPSGPTAHFKLTSFKRGYDIKVFTLMIFMV